MVVKLQATRWSAIIKAITPSAIQTATKANSTNRPSSITTITTKQTVNQLAAPHKTQSLKVKVLLKVLYYLSKILA